MDRYLIQINTTVIVHKVAFQKLIFDSKELLELHKDYPLAPDKIEIKKHMSKY